MERNYDLGFLVGRISATHGSILVVPEKDHDAIAQFDIRVAKLLNRPDFINLFINDKFVIDTYTPEAASEYLADGTINPDGNYFIAIHKD